MGLHVDCGRDETALVYLWQVRPFPVLSTYSDVSLPVKIFSGYQAFENRLVSTL